ncbi:amidohydrolase [Larkinella soli]|uniref:amidohydrolase n=1 Tax=Larkinella soli TaxID=1770527 RepID=UPI000FFCC34C|nr:amidohydrolase [Larkinella soli]
MINRYIFPCLIALATAGCTTKKKADLIVHNALVYTADSVFSTKQAFAVRDGRFVAVGSSEEILDRFTADSVADLAGKPVYPGFYDPHAHFLGLGQVLYQADLVGTDSFEDVLNRLKSYKKNHREAMWLIGRGWDQNDWPDQRFPTRERLDAEFPTIPVALTRVDGHAMLVNSKVLQLAGITAQTRVPGGEVMLENGRPTGVLIDNAMGLVRRLIPQPDAKEKEMMLLAAQKACVALGLTTVSDAGLDRADIELVDRLQKEGKLKIRNYAMIRLGEPNLDYYLKRGPYQTDRLTVRSFKIYADGALGSRGAALRQPYSDRPGAYGLMQLEPRELERVLTLIADSDFQANTHCIGDSANHLILELYGKLLKGKNDRRWRIEHAQVVSPEDFEQFRRFSVLPSVQPTHATSDMYWAADRLGPSRVKGAYAFRQLMEQNGRIAFGSDFPVEAVNPLFGFHAAVARVDARNRPAGGYQTENALDRPSALRAMTCWAAFANFEDRLRGSISSGRQADFVVLEQDIMKIPAEQLRNVKVRQTWIGGEKVF